MAITIDERQALIDRFVALDALGIFLSNLGEVAACPDSVFGERPFEKVPEVCRLLDDAQAMLGGKEYDALFPEEDETEERRTAGIRSERLAARLFLAVAADPAYCIGAAEYFMENADHQEKGNA